MLEEATHKLHDGHGGTLPLASLGGAVLKGDMGVRVFEEAAVGQSYPKDIRSEVFLRR
jgi:hypothetical protein